MIAKRMLENGEEVELVKESDLLQGAHTGKHQKTDERGPVDAELNEFLRQDEKRREEERELRLEELKLKRQKVEGNANMEERQKRLDEKQENQEKRLENIESKLEVLDEKVDNKLQAILSALGKEG